MTHYILITIDLAEQKSVAVKFCKDQAEMSFFQQMFKDDFGDGFVTFAHAYDVPMIQAAIKEVLNAATED